MKKIGLIAAIILTSLFQVAVSQNVLDKNNYDKKDKNNNKETSVEIFRDRMLIDVYQSFWLGMPSNVTSMKFNPGFSTSIVWDIKRAPKSPFSFGIGGGILYHSQNSDAVLKYNPLTGKTMYNIVSMSDSINICRMNAWSLYVPLEFRYRHHNGFKFTLGVRLGYIVGLSQRYKGDDLTGRNQMVDYTDYQILNKMNYNFDVYARIGWKGLGLYYSYQVTSMFKDGLGPKINPMTVGISVSPF
jgi:hypothetical protein